MSKTHILWLLLGLLLLALVGAAVYTAWPVLFPKVALSARLDRNCDLRAGPCTSSLSNGGTITFAVEPRSIPVIKPLSLRVEITGFNATGVEVDFSGVDMYMGLNRVKLKADGEGRFSGGGRIPVCVRDAMEWEAKVMVKTDQGLFTAPYRFITVQPGLSLSE